MRPQIQELVDRCLDAMIDKGPPADLVRDFALPVPSLAIALLLGVPPQAFGAIYVYIQQLVERKQHEPGDFAGNPCTA